METLPESAGNAGFIGRLLVTRPFLSRTAHGESALAPGRPGVSWTEYGDGVAGA